MIGIGLSLTAMRGGGFSPATLFASNEPGVWYDPSDLSTLFQDAAGTVPVTASGQPVGRMLDKSGRGNHATQAIAAARPAHLTTPGRIKLDLVDDNMSINFGASFSGTVLQGTRNGVLHYTINRPTGVWSLTSSPLYTPDSGTMTGMIGREGLLTAPQIASTKAYLQENGAGVDFAGVTDMDNWFRQRGDVTAIYASGWDTSSVTSFNSFARSAPSLATLDVSGWDTSSVTNFSFFAALASSLTTVIVNGGAGNPFADSPCTSYINAFLDTNLNQQSIDDILTAINAAGTSSGSFDQSGGSAPSVIGRAAVTALRRRGWSVAVTGGF